MPPLVIDTNVVVAGLLTQDPHSPVARLLDGMLAARFTFVISQPLLAEYRAVLLRPHLRKLHGLSNDEIDALLTQLAHLAAVWQPGPCSVQAPDPGDQLLWDLLGMRRDVVLVTGDKLLLKAATMLKRCIAPGEACERWLAA